MQFGPFSIGQLLNFMHNVEIRSTLSFTILYRTTEIYKRFLARDGTADPGKLFYKTKTTDESVVHCATMNYPKKTGFNLYQLRHCTYITYGVKAWFLKNLSVASNFYRRNKTFFSCKKDTLLFHCILNKVLFRMLDHGEMFLLGQTDMYEYFVYL